MKIVVRKREVEGPALRRCGHKASDVCSVHACCACYIKRLLDRHYGGVGSCSEKTGGNPMAKKVVKAAKEVRERHVSATDVLIPQFGLARVKDDEALIAMVRGETGSKKFDKTQLAWYKSQYRAGKLKGQNGKPGHPIAQGSMRKAKAPAKKAAKAQKEEPIEE